MPVRIEFNAERTRIRVERSFKSGLGKLAAEILADCNEYCKRDTGTLILSSMIHSRLDEGLLIWQTPYAHRQYWIIPTASTDKNPDATWKWCEAAKTEHIDEWNGRAQKAFKENL